MNEIKAYKKSFIFRENGKNPFLGAKSLWKGRRRLPTKMNITYFMRNEVLNTFSSNNCFKGNNVLGENREKPVCVYWNMRRK